ncbi:class I SAM-dependent DNA methyltransferase [Alicyclobacillus acidiphilus]|uniref:class I SAM-dependent DNA methyltransferase n=1 Tax=Alicyclobacillus acidiphilus TaxID=182455 RepID=UPI000834C038|nr:class I SAM-dependent methyltransferase [Alicyclobacillus acidiphilus]
MGIYDSFAELYDLVMSDAPYDAWKTWLAEHLDLSGMDVVDLGCGTGVLTVWLAQAARTCTGVDASEQMLVRAQARAFDARVKVTWMLQDISRFRMSNPVDLAFATCDVFNYLTAPEALEQSFRAVIASLKPGGRLAFDVIGPSRVRMLQDGYWHIIDDEFVILHETDVEARLITHDVTGFIQDPSGLYRRIEECHQQRYYSTSELHGLLAKCGFGDVQFVGDFGQSAVDEADRLVCIARKT